MEKSIDSLLKYGMKFNGGDIFQDALYGTVEFFLQKHKIKGFHKLNKVVHENTLDQITPIAYEFFFSNMYYLTIKGKQVAWNVIDSYLASNPANLDALDIEYLHSMRKSYLGVYEIVAIETGISITLRDLLEKKPDFIVYEKALTTQVSVYTVLGARICQENNRNVLAGGLVILPRKNIDILIKETRELTKLTREHIKNNPDKKLLLTSAE